jgi:membrane protease YdiL (CAAX protease family)
MKRTWPAELFFYFGIAFAIAWGGILLALAILRFDFASVGVPHALVFFGFMLLGPSVAGLTSIATFAGWAGIADLMQRLVRWRAPVLVWAAILLVNPLTLVAVLFTLSVFIDPEYRPGFAGVGLVVGLLTGICEELGWTGFATPRLLERFSTLRTGLILGVIWVVWHGFADFAGNIGQMAMGDWLLRFAAYWAVPLIAYRVFMTWAYVTSGSLLMAIVAHASYTGWQFALSPAVSLPLAALNEPCRALLWYTIFAVTLSIVVVMIIRFSPANVQEDGHYVH